VEPNEKPSAADCESIQPEVARDPKSAFTKAGSAAGTNVPKAAPAPEEKSIAARQKYALENPFEAGRPWSPYCAKIERNGVSFDTRLMIRQVDGLGGTRRTWVAGVAFLGNKGTTWELKYVGKHLIREALNVLRELLHGVGIVRTCFAQDEDWIVAVRDLSDAEIDSLFKQATQEKGENHGSDSDA
jgi:hypothetical protein